MNKLTLRSREEMIKRMKNQQEMLGNRQLLLLRIQQPKRQQDLIHMKLDQLKNLKKLQLLLKKVH